VDRDGCRSAKDVGLQLADAKRILRQLQEIVVSESVLWIILMRPNALLEPFKKNRDSPNLSEGGKDSGLCRIRHKPDHVGLWIMSDSCALSLSRPTSAGV
jgi:hypothetical protein